ncbi:hypothetical protein [[Pseudomonas] boreopolis]|uniref:hypothetical protein n=1 Tax=Xanthomonas boreopolis TaxID=86183 RepID=UPI003D51292B
MTSHSAVVKRFGCCEALLWVTFLYAAHPCAAPFGPASPCGAAPAARVHKQRKVTRRKAKALAFIAKGPKSPKAKSLDDQPFGC